MASLIENFIIYSKISGNIWYKCIHILNHEENKSRLPNFLELKITNYYDNTTIILQKSYNNFVDKVITLFQKSYQYSLYIQKNVQDYSAINARKYSRICDSTLSSILAISSFLPYIPFVLGKYKVTLNTWLSTVVHAYAEYYIYMQYILSVHLYRAR